MYFFLHIERNTNSLGIETFLAAILEDKIFLVKIKKVQRFGFVKSSKIAGACNCMYILQFHE